MSIKYRQQHYHDNPKYVVHVLGESCQKHTAVFPRAKLTDTLKRIPHRLKLSPQRQFEIFVQRFDNYTKTAAVVTMPFQGYQREVNPPVEHGI